MVVHIMQDETLGYVGEGTLGAAAAEVLADKLFMHGRQPHPRHFSVDTTGCSSGAHEMLPHICNMWEVRLRSDT
jgi:hypothetical protein